MKENQKTSKQDKGKPAPTQKPNKSNQPKKS